MRELYKSCESFQSFTLRDKNSVAGPQSTVGRERKSRRERPYLLRDGGWQGRTDVGRGWTRFVGKGFSFFGDFAKFAKFALGGFFNFFKIFTLRPLLPPVQFIAASSHVSLSAKYPRRLEQFAPTSTSYHPPCSDPSCHSTPRSLPPRT